MAKTFRLFTDDGTWNVPASVSEYDYLLVAGGGAGSGKPAGNFNAVGGGGAGGVLKGEGEPVTPSSSVVVTVGKGGIGAFNANDQTSGTNSEIGNLIAVGGGRGGGGSQAESGGSGGGGSFNGVFGDGTPGQGHDGAVGTTSLNGHKAGGGGGASEPGQPGTTAVGTGRGGDGYTLDGVWRNLTLLGVPPVVAGGGGGGAYRSSGTHAGGPGGAGGGGAGGTGSTTVAQGNGGNATPGTGSGGGGAGGNSSSSNNATRGGDGADGFVALCFEADGGPDVTNVSPQQGVQGSSLTLTGTGFTGVSAAYLGGIEVDSLVVVNDTTITLDSPSGATGLLDLILVASGEIYLFVGAFIASEPVRITQMPVMVVDLTNQPAHVTQLVVQVIAVEVQPARVTQMPVTVPVTLRPVPLPNVIVPEMPLDETWAWLTTVNIKDDGKEQRSILRESPRIRLKIDAVTLDDRDYREVYDILWKYQGRMFMWPLYQYGAFLQAATQGSTTLYFNPSLTDLRVGETAALFDPHTGLTHYVELDSLDTDSAELVEPLPFNVGSGWQVCPAISFRMTVPGTLTLGSISGNLRLDLESVGHRTFQRVNGESLLTTYDGYMVLDKRPLVTADSEYSRNVNWVDSEVGLPLPEVKWRMNFSEGKRSFTFNRYQDMDYWRAFADAAKGRQKAFIHPTFFDDLPLAEQPALGATQLITTNIQADEYLAGRLNKYVRIERQNGVIFRRILDRKLMYDINGDPVALRLYLNQSIGSGAGSNVIGKISFAPLTRLNSDTINLRHEAVDTTITLDIRTVNE